MAAAQLAITCTTTPLLAFFVALIFFRRRPGAAAAVVIGGSLVSLASAIALFAGGALAEPVTMRWLSVGGTEIAFGFLLDGPSLLMGLVVAVIALSIQIYSIGYMKGDPGGGRYFALMGLFAWSMLSFAYAASLLQTFIFWELVGLASFLLIGFWYQKPSASAAARKAFIMTRVGDVGLFIGLIALFQTAGTLDVATINSPETIAGLEEGRLTMITLLMFAGIAGKSAQFPLHTWLPDAMEGPTPVSALLHSATMVAAGVFLFARFHPLFMAAPSTLSVVLAIATFTTLLSSTMAMVARDMKRILAFSSISQLGFMLMGLAAGGLFAGLFHLTTHAIFKALLFLCAGSYIHHHGTNDIVAIGRDGGRKMKLTTVALFAGAAALAGLPPLAGFFSKEAILHEVAGSGATVALVGGYVAAFLTAYYSFRMVFFIVRPNPEGALEPLEPAGAQFGPGHGHGRGHSDSPAVMLGPMLLLAIGAVVVGFFGDGIAALLGAEVEHPPFTAMLPAIGIALAGVVLAWLEYGRKGAAQTGFVARIPALWKLFESRWYFDEIYDRFVVGPVISLARALYFTETRGFDGAGDRIAEGAVATGKATARTQTGYFQIYASSAVVITCVLSLYLLLS